MADVFDDASVRPGFRCEISLNQRGGWRHHAQTDVSIWIKGYGIDGACIARELLPLIPDRDKISAWLNGLKGHFAIVVSTPQWALASVDYVRSIPLAWARDSYSDGWIVDDQAARLRSRVGADRVNRSAALAIAMAGYTIDVATLFHGIEQLGPGEFVLFDASGAERHRYYCYRPWRPDKVAWNAAAAGKRLAECTLEIIDEMMRGLGGRTLIIPLSAGRDSRLIVSAAHHLGHRNIKTFAYGRPGNHEVEASRSIAEKLGLRWRFVPMSTGFMQRYYRSQVFEDYLTNADTLQSVPFVQDMPQVLALKAEGYIPDDAVFANGNSGDYISGNHIVPQMRSVPKDASPEERKRRIVDALYDKHFALWDSIRTPQHKTEIAGQLERSIARSSAALADPGDDYGVYEYAEFQDRQCKYVITGQRIYEFVGHEWRLPLWEKAYLEFFERAPLKDKHGQSLYAETLRLANWGGVWENIPVNRKAIRPHWIRPLRWLAKAAHVGAGRRSWHRFERRYFHYWMENGSHSAIRPYRDVATDSRGARHGVSWLTEAYLRRHGLEYDGSVAGA